MGFLNPWLLLGLAGIAVPIIIHLLNRYRHRRVEWAAMELLRRALVVRSRRIRIEDLLLLLLRCLAVILIALAMARPTLTASGAKWFGGEEQVGAVIAIDASYSMAYRPGVASRFDRAVQTLREVKSALNPGDPLSVALMGSGPRVLLRHTAYDEKRLEKVMQESGPLPERLNLEPCLDQLAALVRETKAPVRELYLVTDGQAMTWENLSEKAKRSLKDIGADARIFLLSTGGDSSENLAIREFSLTAGSLRKGTSARYVAAVHNFGRRPQDHVAVTLLAGETPMDQRVMDHIAVGETVAVPLFVRFEESGNVRLAAQIGQDALALDNVRYTVARVRDEVRVLLVDGDPSDRPFRSETDYVRTALAPKTAPSAKSSLQVDSISWLELPTKSLAKYHVIILANLPDVRQPQVEELFKFVQQGGGLVVFLGDKVNPALFNARLQHNGAALLPAEVLDVATAPGDTPDGWPMGVVSADHPLARAIRYLPPVLMGEARIQRFFQTRLGPLARPILKVAGREAPLLAEKPLGQGKVLLFTTTADRAWTNLPVHPAYPVLLHEVMTYLTTQVSERPLVIGEPLVVSLPRQGLETSVTFRTPAGKELAVQVTERDGQRRAEFEQADRPGFYEVTGIEGTKPMLLAVNVDTSESDVRVLDPAALGTALAGLPVRVPPEGADLLATIRESRVGRELWRILMILGLAVLALEGYLAWRFSRAVSAAETVSLEVGREELLARRRAG